MAPLLLAALALPAPAADAIRAAVAPPGARIEIAGWKADPCQPERAEVQGTVRGSGRVAVRLEGAGCSGWAWAEVRLFAPALVATRAIAAGEPLAGAVRREERELRAGREPLAEAAPDALASRAIAAGTVLEPRHLRAAGPAPGEPVQVVLRSGTISLEAAGRAIPCRPGRGCAVLPSGKRVEGAVVGNRLVVEVP